MRHGLKFRMIFAASVYVLIAKCSVHIPTKGCIVQARRSRMRMRRREESRERKKIRNTKDFLGDSSRQRNTGTHPADGELSTELVRFDCESDRSRW